MSKNLNKVWLAAALTLASASSLATEKVQQDVPGDWYIGGTVGDSRLTSLCSFVSIYCDNEANPYSLYLGYQIDQDWAFEVEGQDSGKYAKGNDVVNIHNLSAKLRYNLASFENSGLYLYGGVMAWNSVADYAPRKASLSPELGLSYLYQVTDNFDIGVGYQHAFNVKEHFSKEIARDFSNVRLMFEYKFGGSKKSAPIVKKDKEPEYVETYVQPEPAEVVTTETVIEETYEPVVTEFDWRSVQAEPVYFDFDSKRPKNVNKMTNIVNALHEVDDLNVKVVGHTDNVGSAALNETLGMKRAEEVKRYLINQGVDAHRIQIDSAGQKRPASSNSNSQGRALNRRAELTLYK